jgi:hypothetical protein
MKLWIMFLAAGIALSSAFAHTMESDDDTTEAEEFMPSEEPQEMPIIPGQMPEQAATYGAMAEEPIDMEESIMDEGDEEEEEPLLPGMVTASEESLIFPTSEETVVSSELESPIMPGEVTGAETMPMMEEQIDMTQMPAMEEMSSMEEMPSMTMTETEDMETPSMTEAPSMTMPGDMEEEDDEEDEFTEAPDIFEAEEE